MIRGTRIPSKIHKKSMQIRCSKKVCRKHEKMSKNGAEMGAKIHENPSQNDVGFYHEDLKKKMVRPVCPDAMYGPPLLRVIRHEQTDSNS